jgi:hypothetical protein
MTDKQFDLMMEQLELMTAHLEDIHQLLEDISNWTNTNGMLPVVIKN